MPVKPNNSRFLAPSFAALKGWMLFLLFAVFYLVPLNGRLLWQPDETRYAEISREMLASGDWIVPRLLGLRYFEKPVAAYWINNLGQWLFGDSNFAVRFGSVLCTALSALLVFWLAMRLWRDRSKALLASAIYLSFFIVYAIGTYAVLDAGLALWLCAAMLCFHFADRAETRRGRIVAWALLGAACGMGFLTKGFLALALPVISVLPYVLWKHAQENGWRRGSLAGIRELSAYGLIAIAAAAAISAPWAIAIHLREPDFWHYFFWVEHIQRLSGAEAQHSRPFWFFLPILALGALPWLGLLPSALARGWKGRALRPEGFYLLCWAAMPFLFFSIAKGKLPTYILPCFAPLALLIADAAAGMINEGRLKALRANGWVNLAAGLVAMVVIGVLAAGIADPVYQSGDRTKIVLALACFAAWSAIGLWSVKHCARRWWLAALCPLLLGLFIGGAIPDRVMMVKQPQYLIEDVRSELATSRHILSNSIGIALGLAWETKRSDILLFDRRGELRYGLDYPDGAHRLIEEKDFAGWLAKARKEGNVSLVLLDFDPERLPVPDFLSFPKDDAAAGRLVFIYYRCQP
ncbi:MAG: lipid IV(A) 4-amino-4-deoxy-L-arabinosyltransferase [Betaproteobacteria bacterium]|nr:lipid IV(A) 4-amino-4-deoxy-L-arabinosyltransferase [Betaproteobacteria bacterium]